jgi:hypothetical protein
MKTEFISQGQTAKNMSWRVYISLRSLNLLWSAFKDLVSSSRVNSTMSRQDRTKHAH